METGSSSSSSSSSMSFYDFLDKMRNPASLNLVKSIKSFIVSFSFSPANPENDGKRVQEFFLTMEAAIMEHPLWAGATNDEIDRAMEGLEKYVMTKLFSRTFAAVSEDMEVDREVSEKIHLLQSFLRPEHLDIPAVLQNEASWLLAEKELQKINAFKAPREKLLCIISCCRIINNLLLNASMSENHVLGGADDFLPVLIYVTIKARSPWLLVKFLSVHMIDLFFQQANPPQLHSNLKFIQLYRRQSKLVSEAAYYLTNLVSAKSFVIELSAKSLSIDEIEFEESMQAARLASNVPQKEPSPILDQIEAVGALTNPSPLTSMGETETIIDGKSAYPYMEAEPGELTIEDVGRLLSVYKDVVTKYTSLCKVVRHLSISRTEVREPCRPIMERRDDLMLHHEAANVDGRGAEEASEVTSKLEGSSCEGNKS